MSNGRQLNWYGTESSGTPVLKNLATALLAAALLAVPAEHILGQGTAADYRRADSLPAEVEGKILDLVDTPTWIPNNTRLWYRKSVRGELSSYLWTPQPVKKLAFDHEKLAAALCSPRITEGVDLKADVGPGR
jgi:hypothetical protein